MWSRFQGRCLFLRLFPPSEVVRVEVQSVEMLHLCLVAGCALVGRLWVAWWVVVAAMMVPVAMAEKNERVQEVFAWVATEIELVVEGLVVVVRVVVPFAQSKGSLFVLVGVVIVVVEVIAFVSGRVEGVVGLGVVVEVVES